MSANEAAEKGLRDRLVNDATVLNIITTAARVVPGWPADTQQAADFPRVTYFVVAVDIRRPGVETVRFQVDEWVWPESGGRQRLLELDEAVVDALDERDWTFGGHRLYALCLSASDHPVAPGYALRRRRDIEVRASPA